MKIIIFAGGTGARLWPLSRKNSPKQFDKLINGKSTLQMAVERVRDVYGLYNVFIQTAEKYVSVIKHQIPDLPLSNIFAEPERRDLAPAVGFAFIKLKKQKIKEPIAIIWSDHLMENVKIFHSGLKTGEKLILENPKRFIYLAEKPRYAENNLGWINVGKGIDNRNQIPIYEFRKWHYHPPLEKCKRMFDSGQWFWNPGYFVTSINFVLSLYRKFQPEIYSKLQIMSDAFDTDRESSVISNVYKTLPCIDFDKAILEKTQPSDAVVLKLDMGWSDPGTLYALKEALQSSPRANVTKGQTFHLDCEDCLIYNQEKDKLITAMGLKGFVIVNTQDACIVIPKDKALRVKDLVKKLELDKKLSHYV
ncbi:hypothetical protein KKB83_01055 [Patescibacteria group bacterium]|nr:hypothetical protein [Patescibacteria group bacterium]